MTDMREAVARALAKHDRIEICSDASYALSSYGPKADAALSLMQPEIDRRVAEERAKLLQRLREPSEGMIEAGSEAANDGHCSIDADAGPWVRSAGIEAGWQAMLAQFEKENSHEQG